MHDDDRMTFWAVLAWYGVRLALVAGIALWVGAELSDAYEAMASHVEEISHRWLPPGPLR